MLQITIDSLGGLGDGIGVHDGKPVFVPKSCAGDTLEVEIVHENREGYQGHISRVITAGAERRTPPCAYFDQCGGCTMQQLSETAYQAFKTRMLHNAVRQAGFDPANAKVTFLPAQTRRRVEFKVQRDGGKIALAFHALRSHTPVMIDHCVVLHPALDALIGPLGIALSHLDLPESLYAVSLTQADSGIDLILIFKAATTPQIKNIASLCDALGIARASVRTTESKARIIYQGAPVTMQLGGYDVTLPAGAFLQATSEGQKQLTEAAIGAALGSSSVVDLFCGIGTYSFALSKIARTHAVELDSDMIQALQSGAAEHRVQDLSAEVQDLFKQPLKGKHLAQFDTAIINPPRLGAKAQTQALAESAISTVLMISCNPATFARDAAILKKAGFMMKSVSAIDQFIWSQHLEIVASFAR